VSLGESGLGVRRRFPETPLTPLRWRFSRLGAGRLPGPGGPDGSLIATKHRERFHRRTQRRRLGRQRQSLRNDGTARQQHDFFAQDYGYAVLQHLDPVTIAAVALALRTPGHDSRIETQRDRDRDRGPRVRHIRVAALVSVAEHMIRARVARFAAIVAASLRWRWHKQNRGNLARLKEPNETSHEPILKR